MGLNMNIKEYIKAGPFGHIATYLNDVYSDPASVFITSRLANADCNTAVLIGTPAHHNMGDHLLADNELHFLKYYCGFKRVIEIPTRVFVHKKDELESAIDDAAPIFITGGGWMGDVWPEDEAIIEQIILSFKNHPIYVFPQTIYYEDTVNKEYNVAAAKAIFEKAKELHIMCRDSASYVVAQKEFSSNNIKVKLMPDMGLLLVDVNRGKKNKCILCCLRSDREKLIKTDFSKEVAGFAKEHGLLFKRISTLHSHPVPIWKRKYLLHKLKKRFKEAELVVTDRLHGMIFSAISGTKCIAFDNATHKVSGVYEAWLKDNPNVMVFKPDCDFGDVKCALETLLSIKEESTWNDNNICCFQTMASEIIEALIRN